MKIKFNDVVIFAGSDNQTLVQSICQKIGALFGQIFINKFADGEINISIKETVRNKEVYIIKSIAPPVNDNLMELLIMVDAIKRACALKITVIIPYLGYSRQDRRTNGRQAITSKLVAQMLSNAGINHVLVLDNHFWQWEAFFDCQTDDLSAFEALANYIKDSDIKDYVIVSPDQGGVKKAKQFSDFLKTELISFNKVREFANQCEINYMIGDVTSKNAIIFDDIIDTAGTIIACAKELKEKSAKDIYVLATHGIFSDPAVTRLTNAIHQGIIKQVIVTNSIPNQPIFDGLTIMSLTSLLAQILTALLTKESLNGWYTKPLLFIKK